MNGLKYGEFYADMFRGRRGFAFSFFFFFFALSSLGPRWWFHSTGFSLSTTVAQSDTVSPQEATSVFFKPKWSRIRRTKPIYRKPQTCWHIGFTAKAFDVVFKGKQKLCFYNPRQSWDIFLSKKQMWLGFHGFRQGWKKYPVLWLKGVIEEENIKASDCLCPLVDGD